VAAARFARARGVDPAAAADEAGLPRRVLDDPHALLPLADLVRAYDALARATDEPLLGLRVGASERTGHLLESIGEHAPTLRELADTHARFLPLLSSALRMDVMPGSAGMAMSWALPGRTHALGRQANEHAVAALLAHVERGWGVARAVVHVELAHPAPICSDDVGDALGVPDVRFDRGHNAVVLRSELLDEPSRAADAHVYRHLLAYAERLLLPLAPAPTFASHVRRCVVDGMSAALPTLPDVAAAFGASPRHVQARLAEEGTSFAAVLEDVREALAKDALRGGASVWDAAVQLHYSDASTFVRAFRRWTGTTPGRWRT
jgi:AraC-like DNA-binding protein